MSCRRVSTNTDISTDVIKLLFILKKRERFDPQTDIYVGLTTGLYNSVKFIHDMLVESGIQSKMFIANDNNDIDREVTKYKPTHVIIEALWVVPDKFTILQKLHPKVQWVVRLHSELPFIAGEGIAMKWIGQYSDYNNVTVASNAPRMVREIKFYLSYKQDKPVDVMYLPNYYPQDFLRKEFRLSYVPESLQSTKESTLLSTEKRKKIINIGCFGAVRPLKNQLIQAISALRFAKDKNLILYFHVNSDRMEMNGEPALHNLIGLFEQVSNKGHKLINHQWTDHEEFRILCGKMDIGMQVSFTETFNIVSADLVSRGVPIVASTELPWIAEKFACNPVDSDDIYKKLLMTYAEPEHNVKLNQEGLKHYCALTKAQWVSIFL